MWHPYYLKNKYGYFAFLIQFCITTEITSVFTSEMYFWDYFWLIYNSENQIKHTALWNTVNTV